MIQETPKASEKLYILDSIDVPLSELNKYRHLSVVNKLPENIILPPNQILPPPPPLRHETNLPDVPPPSANASVITAEPTKPTIAVESHDTPNANANHDAHQQQVKNDFEANVDYDESDLVETKNISIIQHVKKIIKKFKKGKRRDHGMRSKSIKHSNTNNPHIINEHSNDLSTPLRSLSPAHGFDVEMPSAVDLSVNSKEIIDEFEFIDSLSICSDDSESGYGLMASPLTEYLDLTEPQALVVSGSTKNNNGTNEKIEKIPNSNENCDKTDVQVDEERDVEKEKESESENDSKLDQHDKEIENKTENKIVGEKANDNDNECDAMEKDISDKNEPNAEFSIETLRNICISTFNSEKFRSYFTENVINAAIANANAMQSALDAPNSGTTTTETENMMECGANDDDSIKNIVRPDENREIEMIETEQSSSSISVSQVPSLRRLAINAVLLNQCCMSKNLRPFKSVLEAEVERKMIESSNTDASPHKVRTLQELAREVAVTIYSFNVKPLQDICRLAIDKFSHLYSMNMLNRYDPCDANTSPECAVPMENISNLHGNFIYLNII